MDVRIIWMIALAVLFIACVVGIFVLARPKKPTHLPRFPIVLVHGLLGFDRISLGFVSSDYFRVAKLLRSQGLTVHVPKLSPLGSVPARAEQLAKYLRALPEKRVNVIAHSMGGLDARWAIAKHGLGDKVAALVTIGTPHHGSPIANIAALYPAHLLRKVCKVLGLPTDALDWLTTKSSIAMNKDAPDDPRVCYGSVVCKAPASLWRKNPVLLPSFWYLSRIAKSDSDGLVPLASQRWGTTWLEIDSDHWGQIGWSLGGAASHYGQIVDELAQRGF